MEPRRRKRGGLGTSSSPNPAEAHHPPGTPPHGPGSQDGLAKYCPATVSPLSRSRAAPSGDGPTPWKKPGSCPATLHGPGRSRMTYRDPTSRARESGQARHHHPAAVSPSPRSRAAPSGDGPTPWMEPRILPRHPPRDGPISDDILSPTSRVAPPSTGTHPVEGTDTTSSCLPARTRLTPLSGCAQNPSSLSSAAGALPSDYGAPLRNSSEETSKCMTPTTQLSESFPRGFSNSHYPRAGPALPTRPPETSLACPSDRSEDSESGTEVFMTLPHHCTSVDLRRT